MATRSRPALRRIIVLLAAASMAAATLVAGPASADDHRTRDDGPFTLTLLHNNDGESQLIDAGAGIEDFGGIARFATLASRQRTMAGQAGHGVMMLSSGDNFLAGPEFNASLDRGVPFYDTVALDYLRYDAIAIGNHDFDFGPDVLADVIDGFRRPARTTFLSANLDLSGEPELQTLADRNVIAPAKIVKTRGQSIGVIGATTPQLPFISSPRDVEVDPDVAGLVQEQIDRIEDHGVNKVIFVSHLQSIEQDMELAGQLSGVDVMIAGGGAELLANPGDPLVPGDVVYGEYPQIATSADGDTVPVVTTNGDYKYVGRLDVTFDEAGEVTNYEGGPIRVAGGDHPDAVPPNPVMEELVVEPVTEFLSGLDSNVIGQSEVALEGRADPGLRTMETNLGSLMADALRWQANELAPDFGVPQADVAFQNGGGIRNATLIPAGPISELTTFDVAPFANFVTTVPDVPRQTVKQILENGYSDLGGGRFTQVSGLTVTYSASGTPMEIDVDGTIITEGTRVQTVVLDDGTVIVDDGEVVPGAPVTVATIDFLATGGDQYPFDGLPFVRLGATYQQALANYIEDGLAGVIGADDYPEGGSGRIIEIP